MSSPDSPFALGGRTIAVIGASGGIGRACVRAIAAQGGQVILAGRDEAKLQAVAAGLSLGSAAGVALVDLEQTAAYRAAAEKLAPLDGVVFAAGVALLRPFRLTDQEHWRRVFAINVEGPMLLFRELWKAGRLRPNAAVVFIGSIAAERGAAGHAAYAASKAGLIAAVRCVALEMAGAGIRVNVLAPGLVGTEMADNMNRQLDERQAAAYAATYPLGLGRPDDVANGAVFLLSHASRWMTGAELRMDGGVTLR